MEIQVVYNNGHLMTNECKNATHIYDLCEGNCSFCMDEPKYLNNLKVAMACENWVGYRCANQSVRYIVAPGCFCYRTVEYNNANISECKLLKVLIEEFEPHSHSQHDVDQGTKWFIQQYPSQCIILDIFTLAYVMSIFSKRFEPQKKLKVLRDFAERNRIADREHIIVFFNIAMDEQFTDVIVALFLNDDAVERKRIISMYYDIAEKPINQHVVDFISKARISSNFRNIAQLNENALILKKFELQYKSEWKKQPFQRIVPVYQCICVVNRISDISLYLKTVVMETSKSINNNSVCATFLIAMLQRLLQ